MFTPEMAVITRFAINYNPSSSGSFIFIMFNFLTQQTTTSLFSNKKDSPLRPSFLRELFKLEKFYREYEVLFTFSILIITLRNRQNRRNRNYLNNNHEHGI